MVKHINVVKKEIKKLAREVAARNIIAAGLVDKVVARKSVMVNATKIALQRRANVKENVVIIAVPRQAKQTSAARIRKSKEIIPEIYKKNGSESYRFLCIIDLG